MSQDNQHSSSQSGDTGKDVESLDAKSETAWRDLSSQVIEGRAQKTAVKSNDLLLEQTKQNPEAPTVPVFRLWMADNLAMDGNHTEAIKHYDDCIDACQSSRPFIRGQDFIPGAMTHKAQLLSQVGDFSSAISTFGDLYNYQSADKMPALQAGMIAEQTGQEDLAYEWYSRITTSSASAHTDDAGELARRNTERLKDGKVPYYESATELAETLTYAIERQDIPMLNKLVCRSHFAIGPVGGHTGFESLEMYGKFLEELSMGAVKVKRALLGSGGKRYIPTMNWKGSCFSEDVSLMITKQPKGWQWTGIVLHTPTEFWLERWKPAVLQTNDPLPFRLKAPWPKDQCFTAGGLWQYVAEQAIVLASWPFGALVAAGMATGCCGWGPRGYYYNSGPTHDEEDAFAIDFTRYRKYVPYDNESGGTPVLAAHDGIVSKVRAGVGTGNSSMDNRVEVHHADPANPSDTTRFTSKYLHLEGPWKIPVSEGMAIRVGTRLGLMDDTGNSVLDHLHFSIHDRNLPYAGAPEGKSVRPTPMSGVTLGDDDSNKCVKSDNIEYTGTNQMIYPTGFAGQNWLIVPVGLAVNERPPTSIADQKWMMVLSGVALLNFKGTGSEWLRETLHILPDILAPMNHAINNYNIPRPPSPPGYTPQFQVEQWVPHATPSATYNRGHSVNSGFAVDAWRPNPFFTDTDVVSNQSIPNCFTGIRVDIAVSDSDAYFYRISYHISLIGKIRFGKPIIIL